MLKKTVTALLFFCIAFGFSQNKSTVEFKIRNLGINVDGHFNDFMIRANFNSENELIGLEGKIEVKSIRTGIESRDEHLLEKEYFNVEKHPQITLQSEEITRKSSNIYDIKALLTIKGTSKKITIPVEVTKEKDILKMTSYFEINRRDFNVGGSSLVMSKTVKIDITHFQKL